MELRGPIYDRIRAWLDDIKRRTRDLGKVGGEGARGVTSSSGATGGGGSSGPGPGGGSGGGPPPDGDPPPPPPPDPPPGSHGISWTRGDADGGDFIPTIEPHQGGGGFAAAFSPNPQMDSETTAENEELRMYQYLVNRRGAFNDHTVNSGEFESDQWVTVTGDWDYPSGDMEAISGTGGFPDAGQWWNVPNGAGFTDCIVTMNVDTAPVLDCSVVARVSGTGNGYEMRRTGSFTWALNRLDSNVRTQIASGLFFTFQDKTDIGIMCLGNEISAVIDDVVRATVVDMAHTNGRVGLYQASPYFGDFTYFQVIDRPTAAQIPS